MQERMDKWMNEQKYPHVLQDIVPFGAAAQNGDPLTDLPMDGRT